MPEQELNPPTNIRKLPLERLFTDSDAEVLMAGIKPQDMDDKWIVYSDAGWVYFLRSWTKTYIFAIKLDGSPAGVRVTDSWVNDNKEEFNSQGEKSDLKILNGVIDFVLRQA